MNSINMTNLNLSDKARANLYVVPEEEPMYKQFKPVSKDLIPLPKSVLYLLMAALVIVAVAYAIVGHLIKDLANDIADCVIGPAEDPSEKPSDLTCASPTHHISPMVMNHSNAFHVWDTDDVVIPLPLLDDESPLGSPLLMAAIPYMPSFFPAHMHSAHNSPAQHSPSVSTALPQDI
ncbi:hypothetical protein AALO_G00081260 [Alosa alosa]|uniref:Uncharacterized protein n=1 Tax=Alosa alosa TaxID=278164 RepID=A0AAV6H2C3_9TELE|nr:hypothetical protein AALO_G00081260 [Alosa alosa]